MDEGEGSPPDNIADPEPEMDPNAEGFSDEMPEFSGEAVMKDVGTRLNNFEVASTGFFVSFLRLD